MARKRTNKHVPAKGRLRDIADTLWSHAVRSDWAWKCAVCGDRTVEAHHLVPRQHEATRYDLSNGIALCSRHHQFDRDISPHQNAAGWMAWLEEHHPARAEWYRRNNRPEFSGVKNAAYYCEVIMGMREYFEDDEWLRIVGVRFGGWLLEQEGD